MSVCWLLSGIQPSLQPMTEGLKDPLGDPPEPVEVTSSRGSLLHWSDLCLREPGNGLLLSLCVRKPHTTLSQVLKKLIVL